MSFMRTLASVAVGFAASKGLDQYHKMGGMAGLQEMMRGMGASDGTNPMAAMTEQMNAMAGRMGIPGMGDAGANPLASMMNAFAGAGAQASETAAAGLGGLMAAMRGAAASAGQSADEMSAALFGGTAVSVAQEENAKMMLRAMIQAAKADGEIDAQERATILGQLGDDISPEERAFVEAELDAPLDPSRLATDAGDAVKAQIYAAALSAMKVDTASEALYLNQLAHALQIPDSVRTRVHQSMGVPMTA